MIFNLQLGVGHSVLCQMKGVGRVFSNHHILKCSSPPPLFFLTSPLHNKLYIKTTNIPRSFIHCGTADGGSTLVQNLVKYLFIDCGTADCGSTSV